jgi:hypothetical protein
MIGYPFGNSKYPAFNHLLCFVPRTVTVVIPFLLNPERRTVRIYRDRWCVDMNLSGTVVIIMILFQRSGPILSISWLKAPRPCWGESFGRDSRQVISTTGGLGKATRVSLPAFLSVRRHGWIRGIDSCVTTQILPFIQRLPADSRAPAIYVVVTR